MKLTYICILYSSHSLKIYFISRLFFSKCILIFSKDASKSYTVLFSWRCVYFTIVWCTLYNKVIQFMFRLKHTFSLLSAFKQARTWEAVNIVWTKDAACFFFATRHAYSICCWFGSVNGKGHYYGLLLLLSPSSSAAEATAASSQFLYLSYYFNVYFLPFLCRGYLYHLVYSLKQQRKKYNKDTAITTILYFTQYISTIVLLSWLTF